MGIAGGIAQLKLFAKIFVVFCCFAGFLIFSMISYEMHTKKEETLLWNRVDASVFSASVDFHESDRTWRRKGNGKRWCVAVVVEYMVKDHHYSAKLDVGDKKCSGIKEHIDKKIKEFEVGSEIDIFVNPENPLDVRSTHYARESNVGISLFAAIVMFLFFVIALSTPVEKFGWR